MMISLDFLSKCNKHTGKQHSSYMLSLMNCHKLNTSMEPSFRLRSRASLPAPKKLCHAPSNHCQPAPQV